MPSSSSMPGFGENAVSSGMRQRNSAPCGASMGEIDAITSSGTRTTRTPAGTSASTPSDRITVSSPAPYFTASCSSFVPSDTNSPSFSRSLREERSFLVSCSSAFFREVMYSVVISSIPLPVSCWQPAASPCNKHSSIIYVHIITSLRAFSRAFSPPDSEPVW